MDVQEAVVALVLTCRLRTAIGQRVIPPPAYGSWPRARRLANELTDEAEAKQLIGLPRRWNREPPRSKPARSQRVDNVWVAPTDAAMIARGHGAETIRLR